MSTEQSLTRDQQWMFASYFSRTRFVALCASALSAKPEEVPAIAQHFRKDSQQRLRQVREERLLACID